MRFNKEDNLISRRLVEEAISIDAEYGTAYSLLSAINMMDVFLQATDSPQKSLQRAIELSKKSIALGGDAHSLLGWLYVLVRQHEKAVVECQKAVQLNPGSATARTFYGVVLNSIGRREEAIHELEKALRFDPLASSFSLRSLGFTYSLAGRHEEAIETCKKAVYRSPDDLLAHIFLTRA